MAKISDVVELGKAWFIRTGQELADRIIIHTRDKRLDVNDRKFKPLSEPYAKRKASGDIRRQDASSKGANLWLTGDMMSSLSTKRVTQKSVTIGWNSFESEKLVGNANRGRVVTSKKKAVARSVEKLLQKWIDKQTRKNIKKNDTKTVHKLGR